jgi:hypothetical protein
MRRRFLLAAGALAFCALAQRPFRTYEPMEGAASEAELPADFNNKTEFVLGRLMYPASGWRGASWTVDYPRGDRTFAAAIRRLTLVDVRSVEQPVDPDDGNDIYYWPYLHVGLPASWYFSPAQAAKIRDYLQRGGFLMVDSFFGTEEWRGFERGMHQILPGRVIEELPDDDPIFHGVFNMEKRSQVGNWYARRNGRWYRADGDTPYWRGIRDDHGRVVVMINFNNDLGDSWQLADNPEYPERFSSMGIRLGVNYVVYSLTH